MSLSINISASEEKNSLNVFDCTGLYSPNNKGGYGVYNPQIKDVETAVLEITKASTGEKFTVDVFPYLPTTTDVGFEVLPHQLGSSNGEIESDVYSIKMTVTGTYKGKSFSYFGIIKKVLTKSVECCVDKWTKLIDKNVFKDDKQKKAIELNNLLESLCYQIDCELYDEASKTIEYLKVQCQCCGC